MCNSGLKRKVGVVIEPSTNWNLLDKRVVRGRLDSPYRASQIQAMAEVRHAMSAEMAYLAAQRATYSESAELVGIAAKMWAARKQRDREALNNLDFQFHKLLDESNSRQPILFDQFELGGMA